VFLHNNENIHPTNFSSLENLFSLSSAGPFIPPLHLYSYFHNHNSSSYSPLFTGLATLSYLLSGHEVLRLAVNKCVNIKSIVGKHS